MMVSLKNAWLIILTTALVFSINAQHSCCQVSGAAGVSTGAAGMDNGRLDGFGDVAQSEFTNDTSKLSVLTFGYFGYGLSGDGHRADPLGSGGKLPLSYTTKLYSVSSIELPVLTERDLRTQYSDFGYLPLWRNNILFNRLSYRCTDQLRINAGISYGGELGQPGTIAPGQFGIGEAVLVYTPKNIAGLTIKSGNILESGNYCALYNQNPVENFIYTGVLGAFSLPVNDNLSLLAQISGGGTIQNVTPLYETSWNNSGITANNYFRTTRNRSYLNGRLGGVLAKMISIKLSGGYQYVPRDSIENFTIFSAGKFYDKSSGWFSGLEVSLTTGPVSQNISLNYSFGDVITGSGSPDYVRYTRIDSIDYGTSKVAAPVEWFSQNQSASVTGAYWSTIRFERLTVTAGLWGNYRLPAQNIINETSANSRLSDSLLLLAGLDTVNQIVLSTEPSAAIKASVYPTVRIVGPLSLGVRLDRIQYLTPDAHTNTQEPIRDQALRPVRYTGVLYEEVYAPSKWEREAVNATIVTPQLSFDIDNIGGFGLALSQGWYDKPVDRQGVVGTSHFNVTVSTFVNYQFKQ